MVTRGCSQELPSKQTKKLHTTQMLSSEMHKHTSTDPHTWLYSNEKERTTTPPNNTEESHMHGKC